MALSGSHTGTKVSGYSLRIDWSATQSISNNTSTITANAYLVIDSGWRIDISAKTGVITIDGTNYTITYNLGYKGGGAHYLGTASKTITHNTNGTRSFAISGSANINASIRNYGWIGTIYKGSNTYTLDAIPRASSFTLSGATRTNADINVTIAKKSSSFNHRVRWRISGSTSWKEIQTSSWSGTSTSFKVQPSDIPNSKSKEIVVGVQTYSGSTAIGSEVTLRRTVAIPNTTISLSGTANTGSAQTVSISNSGGNLTYTRSWKLGSATGGNVGSWTPPHSALPNSTSGTLTCTVVTKNGTATINTVSATRTITVPSSIMPSVGTIAHAEQNSTVSSLVGAYVQNVSLIKFTPTFTAGSGATISSRRITYRSQKTDQSTLTATANSAGDDLVCSATVTDSRGRTATNSVTITVLPYQNPIVTGVSFIRSNADGTPNTTGTHLTIKATIRVSRLVVNSVEKNKIWYQSQSAQMGSSYTTKTNLGEQAGTINGIYRESVYTHTFSGYPVDYPYNVRVRGGDIFGWSGYVAGGIPTGVVLQHWGEDTTAFGKMIDDVNYNVLVGTKGLKSDGLIDVKGIGIPDTRAVTSVPEDIPSGAVSFDFKSNASVGNPPVTASTSYSHIINVAGWKSHEGSGGWPSQISVGANGLAVRQATSATTWGAWTSMHPIYGSNSNGRYVRFGDGTQICWHSITWTGVATNATAYEVWTFPAVFSNAQIPVLSITAQNSSTTPANASILTAGEYSTIGNPVVVRGIAVKNTSSATRDITAHLIAIGRWT